MELGNLQQYRSLEGYKNSNPYKGNASEAVPAHRPDDRNVTTIKYNEEYLSHEKLTLNYTTKDGDSFSFDYEKIQYQRSSLETKTRNPLQIGLNDEDKDKIKKEMKELYDLVKENMVKELMKSLGFENKNKVKSEKAEDIEAGSNAEIPGLPEYWNAENTSQRIFEFAISFHSLSEQDTEGYYKMMREAIISGYDEAIGEIGETSDEVSALSQRTLELALEKLDAWAEEQGVNVESALNEENTGLDITA